MAKFPWSKKPPRKSSFPTSCRLTTLPFHPLLISTSYDGHSAWPAIAFVVFVGSLSALATSRIILSGRRRQCSIGSHEATRVSNQRRTAKAVSEQERVRRVPRKATGRIHKEQWFEVTVMTDDDTGGIGYWTVTTELTACFGNNEHEEGDEDTFFLSDPMCSICLVEYEHDDTIQRNYSLQRPTMSPNSTSSSTSTTGIPSTSTTACQHVFHKHCVVAWLDTGRRECPCCRSAFVVYQRVEI